MARTAITVQDIAAYTGEVETIVYTAANTNGHYFTHPGGACFMLVKNTHDASLDVVIDAVPGAATKNMDTNLTLSTTNAKESVLSIPPIGYDQGSGVVNVDIADQGDGDDLEIAVFHLIATPS